MINPKANPLLVKVEQERLAKVAPDQLKNVDKIVAAGLRIMDSEQTHKLIAKQLSEHTDPAEIAGSGAAKLLGMMMSQSKGTMPMKAAIPAATVLMLEAMDRLEGLGKVEINNDTVAAATQSLSSSLMQLLKVDNQMLAKMTQGQQPQQPQQPAQPAQPTQPPQPAQPQGQPLIGATA